MNSSTKYIIGGVVLVVLVLGGYMLFGGSANTQDGSLATSSASAADTEVDTDAILQRLNRLRNIGIQTQALESQAFLSLLDFSVTIQGQEIGRDNPFVPPTYTPSGDIVIPNDPSAGDATTVEGGEPAAGFQGQSQPNENGGINATVQPPQDETEATTTDEQSTGTPAQESQQNPPASPEIGS